MFRSIFPESTPIKLMSPSWQPVAMNRESGENISVHASRFVAPSNERICWPLSRSQMMIYGVRWRLVEESFDGCVIRCLIMQSVFPLHQVSICRNSYITMGSRGITLVCILITLIISEYTHFNQRNDSGNMEDSRTFIDTFQEMPCCVTWWYMIQETIFRVI